MSNNKIVQAMALGTMLKKERYEELLEDLYFEVSKILELNPKLNTDETKEITEIIGEMLEIVRDD
tara:strand:- start:1542 stop:1736 length:195 start_codon:yes stop_codon:yes gene_type:complete